MRGLAMLLGRRRTRAPQIAYAGRPACVRRASARPSRLRARLGEAPWRPGALRAKRGVPPSADDDRHVPARRLRLYMSDKHSIYTLYTVGKSNDARRTPPFARVRWVRARARAWTRTCVCPHRMRRLRVLAGNCCQRAQIHDAFCDKDTPADTKCDRDACCAGKEGEGADG